MFFKKTERMVGEANCILALGEFFLARGDHVAARGQYENAFERYQQAGDGVGIANAISGLALTHAHSDFGLARLYFEKAIAYYRSVGHLAEAEATIGLGLMQKRLDEVSLGVLTSKLGLRYISERPTPRISHYRDGKRCLVRLGRRCDRS